MASYSSQDDMFNTQSQEEAPPVVLPTASVDIKEILKELKDLAKKVDILSNMMTEIKGSIKTANNAVLNIDNSYIKKPYLAYLKCRFYTYPWIVEEDEELKAKCRELLVEAGCEVGGVNMVKCYQFASHHFTNWRNQLRMKLVNGNQKNVQGLDLKALAKLLFGSFKSGLETETMKRKNKELVVALTAYMEAHIWGTELKEFWTQFKKYISALRARENQQEYWKKITVKHTKLIEEYNKQKK